MVYSNKLVAVVKHNNNILREDGDIVSLPFGSEYSILLKNLSMQRVLVGVKIDAVDVLSYKKIIIDANSSHELLGFMSEAAKITNRFKFIQKTEQIANYRGDRIDDGFINIDFQFEKPYVPPVITYYPSTFTTYPPVYTTWTSCSTSGVYNCSSGAVGESGPRGPYGCAGVPSPNVNLNIQQDEGITVKGSQINMQYCSGFISNLDPEKHNIIIRLKGYKDQSYLPIYNNTKLDCTTCGRKCKSNMKFCPDCGTSLV